MDYVDGDLGDLAGAGPAAARAGPGWRTPGGPGGQVAGADEGVPRAFGFLADDEHHRVSSLDDDMGVVGGCVQVSGLMSSSVIGLSVLVRMAVRMW
jgi:hypothetical protein